jgi:thiol:disulfide interchange protein DsbG
MLRWIALGLMAFSTLASAQTAPPSGAWDSLARTTWVAEGSSKPARQIYVFTDTECPYCHKLWKAMQPVLASYPDLQVRNILVAVISEDSQPRAETILSSSNPSRAFQRHQTLFEGKGLPMAKGDHPELAQKIQANATVMMSYNLRGTPAMLYRTSDGIIHRVSGVPDEAKLRGILEQAR